MSVIIAGIINTSTGAIVETTTKPKEKGPMRLKVRDTLNVEHGRGAFFFFELDSSVGFSFTYLRNQMRTSDPKALHALELLHARYQHYRYSTIIDNKVLNLETCEDALDKCLELFPDNSVAREFVDEGLSDGLTELRNEIDSCRDRLRKWETKVQALSQDS